MDTVGAKCCCKLGPHFIFGAHSMSEHTPWQPSIPKEREDARPQEETSKFAEQTRDWFTYPESSAQLKVSTHTCKTRSHSTE